MGKCCARIRWAEYFWYKLWKVQVRLHPIHCTTPLTHLQETRTGADKRYKDEWENRDLISGEQKPFWCAWKQGEPRVSEGRKSYGEQQYEGKANDKKSKQLHPGYEEIRTVENALGVTWRRKSSPAGTALEKQQISQGKTLTWTKIPQTGIEMGLDEVMKGLI